MNWQLLSARRNFVRLRAGGMFQWNGEEYRHDGLIGMAGIRKEVSVGGLTSVGFFTPHLLQHKQPKLSN